MSFKFELPQFEMPWPKSTELAVQALLKANDPFVLADSNIDQYNVLLFRQFQEHTNSSLIAIFDQNLLNDVVEIISAALENRPPQRKGIQVAAAAMTFLQAANAMIEPGIAIHEKPDASRLRDLQLFRCADEVDARSYADLALGRSASLRREELPPLPAEEERHDFSNKISGRSVHRICMLKIACLELEHKTPFERMKEYLRWSYEDFIFCAIPTLFACSHLCPNRKKGVLKNTKSRDRERALQEIENALWDVQLIENWAKRACSEQHGSRSVILCSNDEALKRLAKLVCAPDGTNANKHKMITDHFVAYWGKTEGSTLAIIYLGYESRINDSSRSERKMPTEKYQDELAASLEKQLLGWNSEQ